MEQKIFPWVSINGIVFPKEKAVIPIFDKGFLYGYGVFTTLKVREKIPLFFEMHNSRLNENLKNLYLSSRISLNLHKEIQKIININKITLGGIRITITSGENEKKNVTVYAREIKTFKQSVKVITIKDSRGDLKAIKTNCRINNLIACESAKRKGAEDALFVFKNTLVESTYANIFSFESNKNIVTPPILKRGFNGITRQLLLKQLPIQEKDILLNTTNPMVLVNSLSIRIVESINGRKLKKNNSFVNSLQNAIDKMERKYIAKSKNENINNR